MISKVGSYKSIAARFFYTLMFKSDLLVRPYEFKIIDTPQESIYSVKKSKFIAYAFHVGNVEEIQQHLEELRKVHRKARHHCYAYKLGLDGNQFRANDDGEPSGTAGRPILGQIESFGLTDTLIIVVRYFGGVKLGASGLTSAYKTAARQVLEKTSIITKHVTDEILIRTDHQHMGILMTNAKKLGFELGEITYEPSPLIILNAPIKDLKQNLDTLKARVLNISVAEAQSIELKNVFHILDK